MAFSWDKGQGMSSGDPIENEDLGELKDNTDDVLDRIDSSFSWSSDLENWDTLDGNSIKAEHFNEIRDAIDKADDDNWCRSHHDGDDTSHDDGDNGTYHNGDNTNYDSTDDSGHEDGHNSGYDDGDNHDYDYGDDSNHDDGYNSGYYSHDDKEDYSHENSSYYGDDDGGDYGTHYGTNYGEFMSGVHQDHGDCSGDDLGYNSSVKDSE